MTAKEIREKRDIEGVQPIQLQWVLLELAAQIAELNAFNRYMHFPEKDNLQALGTDWYESIESNIHLKNPYKK